MSGRIGIEPFWTLKATWVRGAVITLAQQLLGRGGLCVSALREDECITLDDIRYVRPEARDATVVALRELPGERKLGLHPVAHDLHPGLAGDQQSGRIVPVAPRRCDVDISAQSFERRQHLLELIRLQRARIAIAQDPEIEIAAADVGEHRAEQDVLLPGLAAMCEWNEARRLEAVEGRNSSSIVAGSAVSPALRKAAFEYQIQVGMWMLTGAA